MNEKIHLFPTEKILQKEEKEKLLKQRGIVIWFTGLSGSGKTTIAVALEKILNEKNFLTQVLDGDNIRSGINSGLTFSESDRTENIRRIAEVAKLFKNCGIITLCCFVSPTNELRLLAKNIIGENDFVQVFVNTSLEECEKRDVKGLYEKARKGEVANFTGISAAFEIPENPELMVSTLNKSATDCANELFLNIIEKIKYE